MCCMTCSFYNPQLQLASIYINKCDKLSQWHMVLDYPTLLCSLFWDYVITLRQNISSLPVHIIRQIIQDSQQTNPPPSRVKHTHLASRLYNTFPSVVSLSFWSVTCFSERKPTHIYQNIYHIEQYKIWINYIKNLESTPCHHQTI